MSASRAVVVVEALSTSKKAPPGLRQCLSCQGLQSLCKEDRVWIMGADSNEDGRLIRHGFTLRFQTRYPPRAAFAINSIRLFSRLGLHLFKVFGRPRYQHCLSGRTRPFISVSFTFCQTRQNGT